MHSTCRFCAICRIFSPTALAVSPPTLASTSSNTSTGISSSAASTVLSANITRAISPEEAMARSGRAGSPGLGANWNSMVSKPVWSEDVNVACAIATAFAVVSATSKRLCLKPRSASCLLDGLAELRNHLAAFGGEGLAGAPEFGVELAAARR